MDEIHKFAFEGDLSGVKRVLSKFPHQINRPCRIYQRHAFIFACLKGHDQIVNHLLLYENIKVNQLDSSGYSGLHYACRNGFHSIVKTLLSYDGVEVNGNMNLEKFTPLHLSAQQANKDTVELLLKNFANMNLRDVNGNTPEKLCKSDAVREVFDTYKNALFQIWSESGARKEKVHVISGLRRHCRKKRFPVRFLDQIDGMSEGNEEFVRYLSCYMKDERVGEWNSLYDKMCKLKNLDSRIMFLLNLLKEKAEKKDMRVLGIVEKWKLLFHVARYVRVPFEVLMKLWDLHSKNSFLDVVELLSEREVIGVDYLCECVELSKAQWNLIRYGTCQDEKMELKRVVFERILPTEKEDEREKVFEKIVHDELQMCVFARKITSAESGLCLTEKVKRMREERGYREKVAKEEEKKSEEEEGNIAGEQSGESEKGKCEEEEKQQTSEDNKTEEKIIEGKDEKKIIEGKDEKKIIEGKVEKITPEDKARKEKEEKEVAGTKKKEEETKPKKNGKKRKSKEKRKDGPPPRKKNEDFKQEEIEFLLQKKITVKTKLHVFDPSYRRAVIVSNPRCGHHPFIQTGDQDQKTMKIILDDLLFKTTVISNKPCMEIILQIKEILNERNEYVRSNPEKENMLFFYFCGYVMNQHFCSMDYSESKNVPGLRIRSLMSLIEESGNTQNCVNVLFFHVAGNISSTMFKFSMDGCQTLVVSTYVGKDNFVESLADGKVNSQYLRHLRCLFEERKDEDILELAKKLRRTYRSTQILMSSLETEKIPLKKDKNDEDEDINIVINMNKENDQQEGEEKDSKQLDNQEENAPTNPPTKSTGK